MKNLERPIKLDPKGRLTIGALVRRHTGLEPSPLYSVTVLAGGQINLTPVTLTPTTPTEGVPNV
jgi:hypothetical protein